MIDRNFTFPIYAGEFTNLTNLRADYCGYGIYRCEISRSGIEDKDKLFRFNKLNYYTHFDMTTAKLIGLKINLIQDGQANALLYTTKQLNGNKIFGAELMNLYKIRDKSKYAKKILNTVWGQLASRKKIHKVNDKLIELNNGEEIAYIRPLRNLTRITYLEQGEYYKYDYARIGTFLTSRVRRLMATIMYPYKEDIKHCQTDGFISKVEIPELKIGDWFECWKLKEGSCIIKTVALKLNGNNYQLKYNRI